MTYYSRQPEYHRKRKKRLPTTEIIRFNKMMPSSGTWRKALRIFIGRRLRKR